MVLVNVHVGSAGRPRGSDKQEGAVRGENQDRLSHGRALIQGKWVGITPRTRFGERPAILLSRHTKMVIFVSPVKVGGAAQPLPDGWAWLVIPEVSLSSS